MECIEKNLNPDNEFDCVFEDCKKIHIIKSANVLPVNVIAEQAIKDNLRTIVDYLLNKLKLSIDNFKSKKFPINFKNLTKFS